MSDEPVSFVRGTTRVREAARAEATVAVQQDWPFVAGFAVGTACFVVRQPQPAEVPLYHCGSQDGFRGSCGLQNGAEREVLARHAAWSDC